MLTFPSEKYVNFTEICQARSDYGTIIDALPPYLQEEIRRCHEPPAVCDLAGRDSVAAVLTAFEQGDVSVVLPVVNFKDVQYGSWHHYEETVRFLQDVVPSRYGGTVYDYFVVGDREFWAVLCGRYVQELVGRFGFYSPCPGCHLHFHSMRAIVASSLGGSKVISGERESHDGNIKINQCAAALQSYATVMSTFGVQHLQPVRFVESGQEIENMIGRSWKAGEEQLKCVYSGNYQAAGEKRSLVTEEQTRRFFDEFAIPVALEFVHLRLAGEPSIKMRIDAFVRAIFRDKS